MLTSLYLFIAGSVLCLFGAFGYVDALQTSGLFNDEGDISYENNNGTLSEFTMSSIRCAAKCLQNMSCNAIELCSTPTGQTCRLSRGRKNTGGTLSQSTCKRFQIVDQCKGESYMDRGSGVCIYDGCQSCDCVSNFTQKSGVYGIVIGGDPKHVYCSMEANHTWTVDQCKGESYMDRGSGACIYDGCQSCDCVSNFTQKSGVYDIVIGGDPKHVYCSMEANHTWTVIQRRQDGSEDFYRNWTEYEIGFGSPSSEVWLGNKYIHQLTADGHTVLRIELEDHDGNKRYAEYSSFTVADVTDNYRIHVSGYTGNAGNTLEQTCGICNNGMPFTTYDRDNDNYSGNCALWAKGGWWYNSCHNSCLNGVYGDDSYGKGVNWEDWMTLSYSLKSSVMKVKKL